VPQAVACVADTFLMVCTCFDKIKGNSVKGIKQQRQKKTAQRL